MWIIDLETNGLFPEVDTIHCAVAYNTETKETREFTPETIKSLPSFMDKLDRVSFHNYYGFDAKVINKILSYTYPGVVYDTYMLSRILFPDREGGHSVESWGFQFGNQKVVHTDWARFSPEMLHRCVEDTKIQAKIYQYCINHMKEMSESDHRITGKWQEICQLEHKVWELMEKQADYGWAFDLQHAYSVVDELSQVCTQTEDKLVKALPPQVIRLTKTESGVTKCFKANGDYTESVLKWGDKIPASGDFCRVAFEPFNIGSSQQVKDYLLKHGWEPTEYNFKKDKYNKAIRGGDGKYIQTSPKSPKTSEEWAQISDKLGNPDIALLAEYNKASHRLSQVKGLINATRSDHRIEARADTCATNTARMAHRVVVNIPKAAPTVYYGKQLRSLFVAGTGKILVGVDASALEARCEAHYTSEYDKAQADLLLEGDIHSINAEVFQCDRNTAKTAKYALLYGCGPGKIADILKISMGKAKGRLEEYWNVNSACRQLIEELEKEYTERGYILAIDGRPLTIRYKHALLNTLLQSCGSIIMKKALVLFDTHSRRLGVQAQTVGFFHDEFQIECAEEDADKVGRIAVNCIRQAGRDFNLNVPLDAEYGIGSDWSLTH